MCIISDYDILHELNAEFVLNIKLLFVFGDKGNEVIIISNNDKVFALETMLSDV